MKNIGAVHSQINFTTKKVKDNEEYAVINPSNKAIIYRPGTKKLADEFCKAHNDNKPDCMAALAVIKVTDVKSAFNYRVV